MKNLWKWFIGLFKAKDRGIPIQDGLDRLEVFRKRLQAIPKRSKDLRRHRTQRSLIKMGYRKSNWN